MDKRISFDKYFMIIAKIVSLRSTCSSRPTGSVIVKNNQIISTGYNGSLIGMDHCIDKGQDFCERRMLGVDDSSKSDFCVSSHSETNAISFALRNGIILENSSIYCTLFPCITCFKLLYQSGIKKIYFELNYDSKNKKRDKYWKNFVNQSKIKIEQLIIENEELNFIYEKLFQNTSERKLESI